MLSRVANSLYWMSRYLERADNTARLVDVNLQLLLDHHTLDDQALAGYWRPIVQSAGDESLFSSLHRQATAASVTEFLVFQIENPNSILGAITQSRENARMVRDQITSELWEELNRLYLFLGTPRARALLRSSPVEFFQEIKAASLHVQGLVGATVPHNEGWHFMQAGKYLERADKTSRILDVRQATFPERGAPAMATQTDALEWAAVLRSCSAWDAYKSAHGADVLPARVAEFLLLSEDFPRSVRFCVEELNRCLRSISGVAGGRFSNDAEKLAGRLVAELQFGTAEEIFDAGLHTYIDVLQTKLNAIGEALFQAYIFQPFLAPDAAQLQQQEEQQQQQSLAAPGR
ncbi:MAG TPA: alpha-E domain-containing protein [Opitutaceae bacterium]|nr:alpha-E domain-containing protein [Opitutaceae bacterium]